MSFSIKIKAPNAKNLQEKFKKQMVNSAFVREVNEQVVEGVIKPLIMAGRSPVKGWGRFEKYKDKDIYPAKQKPNRPVNLTLTGKMLKAYKTKKESNTSIRIGIVGTLVTQFVKDKAKGNNEGLRGIPARRFIPIGKESFTISVMRKLKDLFARRLNDIVKKG
jgi:hypothetical protein